MNMKICLYHLFLLKLHKIKMPVLYKNQRISNLRLPGLNRGKLPQLSTGLEGIISCLQSRQKGVAKFFISIMDSGLN